MVIELSTDELKENVTRIREIADALRKLADDVEDRRKVIPADAEPELAAAFSILTRTIEDAARAAAALTKDGQLVGA